MVVASFLVHLLAAAEAMEYVVFSRSSRLDCGDSDFARKWWTRQDASVWKLLIDDDDAPKGSSCVGLASFAVLVERMQSKSKLPSLPLLVHELLLDPAGR